MSKESANPGVGTLLRQLLAQLDGDLQAQYESRGLSFRPRFYPIFQCLLREGTANVNAIAAEIRASQPAATQTINELKRLGLVAVAPGGDRRQKRIMLTAEGLKMAAELRPLWQATERAAAALDTELPYGLRATLDAALRALERRSFAERINNALSEKET